MRNARASNKNINIRVSQADLDRIRAKAEREGLPYQTLISSVLHKYVNDQLVDEDQVVKTLGVKTFQQAGEVGLAL